MSFRFAVSVLNAFRLCAAIAIIVWTTGSALAERVALLIGNAEYLVQDMALRNPVNDVTALGAVFRDLGFDVIEHTNGTASEMRDALRSFETRAAGADMAVVFFAGHGVQVADENNLVGVEFAGGDLGALRRASITSDEVRNTLSRAGAGVGILILDACRDNPFSLRGAVQPGLVRDRGGAGLLIAYATDPGNVAYDGVGQNSVFTTSLLEHLRTPGLDARLMFGRVRQQVVLDTGGRQIPWVEESVLGAYSFAEGDPSVIDDKTTQEVGLWRRISNSRKVRDFEAYIAQYPDGLFTDFARDRIDILIGGATLTSRDSVSFAAPPEKLAAALASLGLYSSNHQEATPEGLATALTGYQRQLSDPRSFTDEQLFTDATRVSMFLAATTLQRLRTDLVALRSVERTLGIAQEALAEIELIAETNDAALPVLRSARADINDIRRSRGVILRRLDQSRSYYDELLTRTAVFVPDDASLALLGEDARQRNLGQPTQSLTENAALFLEHLSAVEDSKKGSYQWLAQLVSSP